MPFVLDTSVTLAWYFEDETSEYSADVLRRLRSDSALVPSLWPIEVANGLLSAERRGRITPTEIARAVAQTLELPIAVHDVSPSLALGRVSDLSREHRLTVYDAAYLELAMREALPLATLDDDLLAAAQRVGLPELA